MSALWSIIASWMYQYGSIYAGIPSSHGSYEAPVPEQLQKQAEWEKNPLVLLSGHSEWSSVIAAEKRRAHEKEEVS